MIRSHDGQVVAVCCLLLLVFEILGFHLVYIFLKAESALSMVRLVFDRTLSES